MVTELRSYIESNFASGYPFGPNIRYECLLCGLVLASTPTNAVACACNNIIVDADAGRVAVKDISKFRAFRAFEC